MHWMGMGRPPPDELEEYVKEVRRPSYQRGAGRIEWRAGRFRGLFFCGVVCIQRGRDAELRRELISK
jgi:hypothetical protein